MKVLKRWKMDTLVSRGVSCESDVIVIVKDNGERIWDYVRPGTNEHRPGAIGPFTEGELADPNQVFAFMKRIFNGALGLPDEDYTIGDSKSKVCTCDFDSVIMAVGCQCGGS